MAQLCPAFDVVPCPYAEPEDCADGVLPHSWALSLAHFKARAVADRHPDRWVVGADTIVVCNGEVLGKPRDLADARRMLEVQARAVSVVLTGVCLLRWGTTITRHAQVDTTRVWMRDDSAAREVYLATGDWAGKAGAYGIQNVGDRLVDRIEGSFSNVVGLPLELLARMFRYVGLPVTGDPGAS